MKVFEELWRFTGIGILLIAVVLANANEDINDNEVDPSKDDIGAILINTVYSSLPDQNQENGQAGKVPELELKKLKAATKGAGLSDVKADRVLRAVHALDLGYTEVKELKDVMISPSTTAHYADRVRRALEDAVVDKHLKAEENKKQEPQIPSNAASSDQTVTPSDQRLNSDPLKKLKIIAHLSGADETAANRLARAVVYSGLEDHQVHQLSEVMQQHAASAGDLDKLTQHLEETDLHAYKRGQLHPQSENFHATPAGATGADWVYHSNSNGDSNHGNQQQYAAQSQNQNGNHGNQQQYAGQSQNQNQQQKSNQNQKSNY